MEIKVNFFYNYYSVVCIKFLQTDIGTCKLLIILR